MLLHLNREDECTIKGYYARFVDDLKVGLYVNAFMKIN